MRGELDWIVMKALEKDRTRRYETANGFARDIQRYLDGDAGGGVPAVAGLSAAQVRPQASCGADHGRGVRTDVDRRGGEHGPGDAGDPSGEGGPPVGAGGGPRGGPRRGAEAQAKREAEHAQKAEAQAKLEAEKAKAVNEFLTQDLLTQAEPENNDAVDRVTLLEVLDRAAAKVGERFAGRPELEESLRRTMARTYHGLGAWEPAEAQWRAVVASARRRLGPDAPEVLTSEGELGHLLNHRGQDAEAVRRLEAASEGLGRVLGPDHPNTLISRNHLASAYEAAGRTDEAIRLPRVDSQGTGVEARV